MDLQGRIRAAVSALDILNNHRNSYRIVIYGNNESHFEVYKGTKEKDVWEQFKNLDFEQNPDFVFNKLLRELCRIAEVFK